MLNERPCYLPARRFAARSTEPVAGRRIPTALHVTLDMAGECLVRRTWNDLYRDNRPWCE